MSIHKKPPSFSETIVSVHERDFHFSPIWEN